MLGRLPLEMWREVFSCCTFGDYMQRVDIHRSPKACVSRTFYFLLKHSLCHLHVRYVPSPRFGGLWAASRGFLASPVRQLNGQKHLLLLVGTQCPF